MSVFLLFQTTYLLVYIYTCFNKLQIYCILFYDLESIVLYYTIGCVPFDSITSLAMLHRTHSSLPEKRLSAQNCTFLRFSNTFLLQIKVCNIVIHPRAGWFDSQLRILELRDLLKPPAEKMNGKYFVNQALVCVLSQPCKQYFLQEIQI